MGYVQAGYTIVLAILFLYGVQLIWRRRRLTQSVDRVLAADRSVPVGTPAAGPSRDDR